MYLKVRMTVKITYFRSGKKIELFERDIEQFTTGFEQQKARTLTTLIGMNRFLGTQLPENYIHKRLYALTTT